MLVKSLGENALFGILEPPAFQKYSIHWVLEALCICLCLCLCVFFCICLYGSLRLGHCHHQMVGFQKIYGLYGLVYHTVQCIKMEMSTCGTSNNEQRR